MCGQLENTVSEDKWTCRQMTKIMGFSYVS